MKKYKLPDLHLNFFFGALPVSRNFVIRYSGQSWFLVYIYILRVRWMPTMVACFSHRLMIWVAVTCLMAILKQFFTKLLNV